MCVSLGVYALKYWGFPRLGTWGLMIVLIAAGSSSVIWVTVCAFELPHVIRAASLWEEPTGICSIFMHCTQSHHVKGPFQRRSLPAGCMLLLLSPARTQWDLDLPLTGWTCFVNYILGKLLWCLKRTSQKLTDAAVQITKKALIFFCCCQHEIGPIYVLNTHHWSYYGHFITSS